MFTVTVAVFCRGDRRRASRSSARAPAARAGRPRAQLRRDEGGREPRAGPHRVGPALRPLPELQADDLVLHLQGLPAAGRRSGLPGRRRRLVFHDLVAARLAHEPRPEDRRPRDPDREHLRRPAAGGVRHLHGLRTAPRRDRHSVLHLQEGGLGLRDQPGWGSTLPLASRSRFISEATSGIAASTGIAQTGQSTSYPWVFSRYGDMTSIITPATSGPTSRPMPLVVVARPAIAPRCWGGISLKSSAHASVITVPPPIATGKISP